MVSESQNAAKTTTIKKKGWSKQQKLQLLELVQEQSLVQ
jgi:hypothetical protein